MHKNFRSTVLKTKTNKAKQQNMNEIQKHQIKKGRKKKRKEGKRGKIHTIPALVDESRLEEL